MKNAFPPLLSVLLFAWLPFSGRGASGRDEVLSALQKMVAEKASAYRKENQLPENAGVLIHLVTPKGAWTVSSGLPPGADENTHYRIASVSKTFTAAGIMLLDQQGKLRIGDTLSDNIPGTEQPYLAASPNFAIPNKEKISIRDLLSHRAGVFDVFNSPLSVAPYNGLPYGQYVRGVLGEPDHQFTAEELISVLADNRLSYSDGERKNGFKYSDTGYTILAKIIERVSGKSYDRFVLENLCKPAGLEQTSLPWSSYDVGLPEPFMKGYARLEAGADLEDATECNMSDQIGPGNIISTPADMGRWIRSLLSGRGPLNGAQVQRMIEVPEGNATYALGIGTSEAGKGHSGAHPGYINLVAYDPKNDVAVVVVTPFIDYSKLHEHLALVTDLAKESRRIAGYPAEWEPSGAAGVSGKHP